MSEILFVKTSSLGDVIHHMPALTEARRQRPDARFSWVVEEAFAPLVRLHPAVSEVIPVGLEPNGEMEVPPASQAGWYFYGPRPGETDGTAVIAAHVDFGGERGVFFDLRSLQVGEEVAVTDEAGGVHRYRVTERYQVDKDELPIEQIFVADGPPGLTLITCGGSFDSSARSYQDNIVVRAVPA